MNIEYKKNADNPPQSPFFKGGRKQLPSLEKRGGGDLIKNAKKAPVTFLNVLFRAMAIAPLLFCFLLGRASSATTAAAINFPGNGTAFDTTTENFLLSPPVYVFAESTGPAYAPADQGSHKAYLKIVLSTAAYTYSQTPAWSSLNIHNAGTAPDSSVKYLRLYQDDGDGIFNTGIDVLKETASGFNQGSSTFTINPTIIIAQPTTFFIAVELEDKLNQSQEKALSFAYELKGREAAQKEARREMDDVLSAVKQQQLAAKVEKEKNKELENARGRIDILEQKILELSSPKPPAPSTAMP